MTDVTTLKQKVKNTALLADEEKVDILAALDGYTETDRHELESIIDEYNTEHARILNTFEKNMDKELDAIVGSADPSKKAQLTAASNQIKQGISAVVSGHLSPRP